MAEADVDDDGWAHISLEDNQEKKLIPNGDTGHEDAVNEGKSHRTIRDSFTPLTRDECMSLFDPDGRLVKENNLRKALFEGGVDISYRAHIWKFIFNIYPFNSTDREQVTIDLENRARYKALHDRWVVLDKTVNLPDEEPSSDPLEYLQSSDTEEDIPTNEDRLSHVYSFAEQVTNVDSQDVPSSSDQHRTLYPDHLSPDSCPYCNTAYKFTDCSPNNQHSLNLVKILEFPSKVYATRQPVDLEKSYPKSKRIILRDVKRTDRTVHYFSHKRNLRKVHRLLHIYALYHPDIGYCQGMNDILARFLVVTDCEVDSYWMFSNYMSAKRVDFLENSMMDKIAFVQSLLQEMDEELYWFFEISECSDYLFCHRWLLLDFKREFNFSDSLKLLEVIACHYMTISSDRTLIELEKVVAEEFAAESGEVKTTSIGLNQQYSFDVFICVAILLMNKKAVSKDLDAASIYGCLNSLSQNLNINNVLSKAEELFHSYCRKKVASGTKETNI